MEASSSDGRVRLSLGDTHSAEAEMSIENLSELIERLHEAIGQLEEAQEVVQEAAVDIENEIERLQRASPGKWGDKILNLINDLDYTEFKPPISVVRAYTEADNMSRVSNWIGELEQSEEPDDNAS